MTRLLLVTAPQVSFAVWIKSATSWECVEASPAAAWMVGATAERVGAELKSKGWVYQWLAEVSSESLGGTDVQR